MSTYLSILGLDPGRIETFIPEGAFAPIWAMISAAVNATDVMRACLTSRCGRDGRVRLGVTLATRAQGTMLVALVRSITMDALDPRVAADGGMMSPSPAMLAKNHTQVGVSQPDLATMAQDEDELAVDSLGRRTGLGVPDLEKCMARRGVRRVANNAGDAHKVKVSGGGRGV